MLRPTEPSTCHGEDAGVGCCPWTPEPLVPSSCPRTWPWLHGLGKGKGGTRQPVTARRKQPVAGITSASPVPEMQPPLGWDPAATCIPPHLPPSDLGGIFFFSFSPTS